jgi:mono/diheme cytochrome c family protein
MFALPVKDSPQREAAGVARLRREEEFMPTRFLAALALAVGPLLVASAGAGPARDVGHGKDLFLRYCSGCHGVDGRGEAKTFQPNVGNLAVKELMDQLSDEYLFTAIKKGGAAVGKNAAMPAWQQQLDDSQIWDIVGFVRTFGSR